ncbi:NAD(P)-dependent oxidoreductase [Aquabacter spiritensis]|uniref:2-hydroxy-3-oxopropionate reductase n=1 Tax=Aquabacter spiritensis TaxID=933073 RepID=A0A4R3LZ75_9HYPH|nr:NAD(P)-dependent oxidoreductase [Aquabacter spiritensis]TCT05982.1 2-hydroxy-3-oxopropionate reductase [Aquabacter spiritensis]
MSGTAQRPTVGVVGLGIMGFSYARNLREAGFPVIGFDVAEAPLKALAELGGEAAASPKALAEKADVILIALASVDALKAACGGAEGMIHTIRPGTVVCEMGTFPMYAKTYVRDLFEPKGVPVLDCPVSGTGAQAAVRDLVVYASGDEAAAARIRPVFDGFARNTRYVGAFGAGIKLKFVANLLVTIHNLATAEALLMAEQSGLDLDMVFEAIRDGAGNSRMFEVRGPMMIKEQYQPATMKMDVYMKDLTLITEFARDVRTPTPLMNASVPFYVAALAAGRDADDTAALYAVLKEMTQKK